MRNKVQQNGKLKQRPNFMEEGQGRLEQLRGLVIGSTASVDDGLMRRDRDLDKIKMSF